MQLNDEYVTMIKKAAGKVLSGDYSLMVFGSRSTGSARPFSDIDLAIDAQTPVTLSQILQISGELDGSNIPYKVDVVDLKRTEGDFRANILRDGVKI